VEQSQQLCPEMMQARLSKKPLKKQASIIDRFGHRFFLDFIRNLDIHISPDSPSTKSADHGDITVGNIDLLSMQIDDRGKS
jgi:hypothetical protein